MSTQEPIPSIHGPIGISNIPNQIHELVATHGMDFGILLVGSPGIGKTTFINNLLSFSAASRIPSAKNINDRIPDLTVNYCNLIEKGFVVRLTIAETKRFGGFINNNECPGLPKSWIEKQYERYNGILLNDKSVFHSDPCMHACLYFIEPRGSYLTELDIVTMKELSRVVNLIPVIGKADLLTGEELTEYKNRISQQLIENGVSPFGNQYVPYAIIGSEEEVVGEEGRSTRGRHYKWGVCEVENQTHSEFKQLRNTIIRLGILDLIEKTHLLYQQYSERLGRVARIPGTNSMSSNEEEYLRLKLEKKVEEEEERIKRRETVLNDKQEEYNGHLEMLQNKINELKGKLIMKK